MKEPVEQRERLHRLQRDRGGRAGAAVERRQLAQHVSRPADPEHDLATVVAEAAELHEPLAEDQHAVGQLVLVEQRAAGGESADDARWT